jgi:Flp pilus assembly protein TadG
MRSLRRLIDILRTDRGTALVEFALVLPIMVTLFLGAFETTRLVAASMRLANAAQEMADMVAQNNTVNNTMTANFCAGGGLSMYPLSSSSFKAAIASVTNSSGTVKVDWNDTTCNSATAISNATTLATSDVPNVSDSVIIVEATFAYTSPIAHILSSAYTLTQYGYARPRANATINHS